MQVLLPDGRPIPCVLLGNKCDQPASGAAASDAAVEAFSKEKGFAGWFNVSAKENTNVEEAARFLIEKARQESNLYFLVLSLLEDCKERDT